MRKLNQVFATAIITLLWAHGSWGQGTTAPTTAPSAPASTTTPTTTGANTPAAPSTGTFSIEAEMFAYKALQSDSEAIACDVASYLFKEQVTPTGAAGLPDGPNEPSNSEPPDATGFTRLKGHCGFDPVPDVGKGVVIVSSTGSTIANYQAWRINMIAMNQLLIQAKGLDSRGCSTVAPADATAALSVASEVLTLVQGVLGLFASNQSFSAVTGSIQDQALMSDVGRQLRSLSIPVLMPDTFTSFAFGNSDPATSPFLSSLSCVFTVHSRLQDGLQVRQSLVNAWFKLQSDQLTVKADEEKLKQPGLKQDQKDSIQKEIDQTTIEITALQARLKNVKEADVIKAQGELIRSQSLLSAIEAYLANLTGGTVTFSPQSVQASALQPTGNAPTGNTPSAPNPTAPISPTSAPGPVTPPIVAVLSADGLARALGISASDANLEPATGWHLLWLKALESGGGLTTESNIFGSKVHFSGGAVATYGLFRFNGNLSCSGNVMDYGGYVRAKDFTAKFNRAAIHPREQMIFLRGGCAAETREK